MTAIVSTSLGPGYRRLWASSAASNLADGVFYVALPLIAVRLTESPLLIAGIAIAGRLPWLFFVLIAGALADRLDRRRTMVAVQLLRAGVVGLMAVLALVDLLSLPVLFLAALALGIGETLFDTAAQSILPSIVRVEQLSLANGRLYAVELVMNQFDGPPLGGVLVALSVPLALAGAGLGYVLAAVGLLLLAGSFRPARAGPARGLLADITEGLRFLMGHRLLRTLAVMVGIINFSMAAAWAIFVLYAVRPGPMGLDEPAFGLLVTGLAAGSVAGSILVSRMERLLGPGRVLWTSVVLTSAATLVPGLTTNAIVVGASFVAGGFASVMWNVITVSLRQRLVPDALLGRVNASYRLFAWGTQPLGALAGGLVGELLGLPAVFILAGLLIAVLLAARGIVTDEALRRGARGGG